MLKVGLFFISKSNLTKSCYCRIYLILFRLFVNCCLRVTSFYRVWSQTVWPIPKVKCIKKGILNPLNKSVEWFQDKLTLKSLLIEFIIYAVSLLTDKHKADYPLLRPVTNNKSVSRFLILIET